MTDRELLELAAKAAGWPVTKRAPLYMCAAGTDLALIIRNDHGGESVWNPLADDGDALRLAVHLGLQIIPRRTFTNDQPIAVAAAKWADDLDTTETYYDGNPAAATRRAIVRAAAEIGKAA